MITLEQMQKELAPMFPGLMGVRLLELTRDRVVATMTVREDLSTSGHSLHGGAFMAFADTLGAVATIVNLPEGAGTTTIESKTNFVRGAAVGTSVTGECTPFHRGRTTMVWQTQIFSEDRKLCAVVTQTQMVLHPRA